MMASRTGGNAVKIECSYCHKMVRDKAFFGTMHVCLTGEERDRIDEYRRLVIAQRMAKPITKSLVFGHSVRDAMRG
jgi:hypothetical protein